MRRAAAYHKECILVELILACIFIVLPLVAVFALAGVCIGNAENYVYRIR